MVGGVGGVIQIIVLEGEIVVDILLLKCGENGNNYCDVIVEDGYFFLEGKLRNI